MDNNSFVYLLELLQTPLERALLADLRKDVDDDAARNALVDFLLEQGRNDSAELIRGGWIPTKGYKVQQKGYFSGDISRYRG